MVDGRSNKVTNERTNEFGSKNLNLLIVNYRRYSYAVFFDGAHYLRSHRITISRQITGLTVKRAPHTVHPLSQRKSKGGDGGHTTTTAPSVPLEPLWHRVYQTLSNVDTMVILK